MSSCAVEKHFCTIEISGMFEESLGAMLGLTSSTSKPFREQICQPFLNHCTSDVCFRSIETGNCPASLLPYLLSSFEVRCNTSTVQSGNHLVVHLSHLVFRLHPDLVNWEHGSGVGEQVSKPLTSGQSRTCARQKRVQKTRRQHGLGARNAVPQGRSTSTASLVRDTDGLMKCVVTGDGAVGKVRGDRPRRPSTRATDASTRPASSSHTPPMPFQENTSPQCEQTAAMMSRHKC